MTPASGRGPSVIVAAILIALAVGALGAWITQLSAWYYALRFPPWKPPDWLFGPAWTTIFACAAAAGVIAWRAAPTRNARWWVLVLFALNINLNLLWSGLFFRLQRPDYAFLEVVLLWLSIVALIVAFRRDAPKASWLLAPYLLWVTYAAALNFAIVRLNAPFPGAGTG
ncbi:MAG: TspO/MBR family protein [Casimicrobiaceae bacterium]